MSYKVYKSQNYFVVHDTATSTDVIRQVRNLIRWEKLNSIYSFYWNTPNLTTVGNSIVRLGTFDFSDLVDSTGTAWASESVLDLYLEQWTGHICCPIVGDDASYTLKNSEGTVLDVGTIASGGTADITAPDATININKTPSGLIASIDIPSGTTTNYSVADNAITVNGANGFTIDATAPLDIVLSDGTSTVTPTSVTPNSGLNKVDIVLPANSPTYASARLLKTGQTTSYRTGDDGDLEAGRDASFTTLLANNPFGNANRFTDILGGQTYTTAIVIDWSTYDGVSVLGYTKNNNGGLVTWNTAIDGALATSISTFTSGWRLPNRNELENIINDGVATGVLNYAPFNFSTDVNIWSSTTARYDTTRAVILGSNSTGWVYALGKTSASCYYYACRTFTVTGTTLY
jgi:hypothetical protein